MLFVNIFQQYYFLKREADRDRDSSHLLFRSPNAHNGWNQKLQISEMAGRNIANHLCHHCLSAGSALAGSWRQGL